MKSIEKMTSKELRKEKRRLTGELLVLNQKNMELRRERDKEIKHATSRLELKMADHLARVGQPSGVLLYELNELRKRIPVLLRNPKARALMCEAGDYDDFRGKMDNAGIWNPPIPVQKRWKLLNE